MSSVIPFEFDTHTIRTIYIDDQPWFVGKDVAEALGYADSNKAVRDHCKGEPKRLPLETAGGLQEVRLIDEPDVYRLIMSSRLPAAERFERWVFEEVLPTIRRTGSYGRLTLRDQLTCSRQITSIVNRVAREHDAFVRQALLAELRTLYAITGQRMPDPALLGKFTGLQG